MINTAQIEKRPVPRSLEKLWVPEYSEPREEFFLADLDKAQLWISELPMANVSETARQVLDALVEFNRQEIPNQNPYQGRWSFSASPFTTLLRTLKALYRCCVSPVSKEQKDDQAEPGVVC